MLEKDSRWFYVVLMRKVYPRPVVLDAEMRWVARVEFGVIDGRAVPIGLEVRLKPECSCVDECTCDWPVDFREPLADKDKYPLEESEVPAGGFPMRRVQQIRMKPILQDMSDWAMRAGFKLDPPDPDKAKFMRDIASATIAARVEGSDPKSRRGRPQMKSEKKINRFVRIAELRAEGKTLDAIARRMRLSVGGVRDSLRWGGEQGLWETFGRGRPGQLTTKGQQLVDEVRG